MFILYFLDRNVCLTAGVINKSVVSCLEFEKGMTLRAVWVHCVVYP